MPRLPSTQSDSSSQATEASQDTAQDPKFTAQEAFFARDLPAKLTIRERQEDYAYNQSWAAKNPLPKKLNMPKQSSTELAEKLERLKAEVEAKRAKLSAKSANLTTQEMLDKRQSEIAQLKTDLKKRDEKIAVLEQKLEDKEAARASMEKDAWKIMAKLKETAGRFVQLAEYVKQAKEQGYQINQE